MCYSTCEVGSLLSAYLQPGTMDGVKLAHFIRERWPPVHLIIVSGIAVLNESQIPYGTKFFSKPYHDETLVAELQRLMQSTS